MDRLDFCPNSRGYYYTDDEWKLHPIPCKSLKCAYCGPVRRMKILNDVAGAFDSDDHVRFCTLTLKRYGDKQKDKLLNKNLSKYWARLRSWLTKIKKYLKEPEKYPVSYEKYKGTMELVDNFKWVYTIERTEKGMLHMHILWNIYIRQDMLTKLWWLCTDKTSYWVKVKDANIKRPSGYLYKYITKAMNIDIDDKKIKVYGFSRNIKREKFVPDKKYKFISVEHSKHFEEIKKELLIDKYI